MPIYASNSAFGISVTSMPQDCARRECRQKTAKSCSVMRTISMAGHYASADIGRLIKQANLVLNRDGTCTVLRVANG